MALPRLEVRGLTVRFGGNTVVDDVSFTVDAAECVGLVGASGSGKSVTSLALMGLLPQENTTVEGSAILHLEQGSVDLLRLTGKRIQRYRGNEIAMVFQEPMTALDPVYPVGEQVAEAVRKHLGLDHKAARRRVISLFEEVQLPEPEQLYRRYPHQLSGGQKQRVVIAMAISCGPKVLLCDEPTTALDVLVQREVLDILRALRAKHAMGMVFITHDLGVVAEVAERVLVMHRGKVVEQGDVQQVFSAPEHPYTKGLLACRPVKDPKGDPRRLPTVEDLLAGRAPASTRELIAHEAKRAHVEALLRQPPLLRIEKVEKVFTRTHGPLGKVERTPVLHDITFAVHPGESLGIVGGSGSGKTTLGRSILQLIQPTSGHVFYKERDLTTLSPKEMRSLRRELQIIFQDPYSSLNPRMAVGRAIAEAMEVHGIGAGQEERRERTVALLRRVGLEAAHFDRFPHQFSGGQRQRIVIARALALEPTVIICDESIAALDVSVQAQVLNLLNDLQDEHGLTYLFISHDLNAVRYFCDRILVLERGGIAEIGGAEEVTAHPASPYTRRLVNAIPGGNSDLGRR